MNKEDSSFYNGSFYDQYEEGAIGKFKHSSEDVPFLTKLALEYGTQILELACGTGRIAIPLANQGINVVGIDSSDSMLSAARKKSSKVKWLKSDMRDFSIEDKFDLVIIAYNSFLHLLTIEDAESCLLCVKRHLKPNGRLILDVVNPSPTFLTNLFLYDEKVVTSIFKDPEKNATIMASRTREYDAMNQVVTFNRFYKYLDQSEEMMEIHKFKVYFPKELKLLLYHCGFTIEKMFGNYNFSAFSSNSENQIIICY